jgi:hypothetical protein
MFIGLPVYVGSEIAARTRPVEISPFGSAVRGRK